MNEKQKKSIFLIGMMASGKSTVGKELAKMLNWEFFDMDDVIVAEQGKSIPEIFKTEGEAAFRFYETQATAQFTQKEGVVLAMGGGTPMFEVNHKLLARGFVVQLSVRVSDVIERTKNDTTRPLLQAANPVQRVRELLIERAPIYDAVSDMKVSVTRKSPHEIAQEVLEEDRVKEIVAYVTARKGKQ